MWGHGSSVAALEPQGAIYLSARFALRGCYTPEGRPLETDEDVRTYLLNAAGVAIVPFQAFGVTEDTGWFPLSVRAVSPGRSAGMPPPRGQVLPAVGARARRAH